MFNIYKLQDLNLCNVDVKLSFYVVSEILGKVTTCNVVSLSSHSAHGFPEVWYSWLMRLMTFTTSASHDEDYKPYLGFYEEA